MGETWWRNGFVAVHSDSTRARNGDLTIKTRDSGICNHMESDWKSCNLELRGSLVKSSVSSLNRNRM
jgi:hypothetical protein